MRLLHAQTIKPRDFIGGAIPPYAILSHTWGDEEFSFQDLGDQSPAVYRKIGYKKIQNACQEARRQGLMWVWVDTCCIDKSSSTELSEAINSMFQWYRDAEVCFAYLGDVQNGFHVDSPTDEFVASRWFTRGWTLQELLAPANVLFFSSTWQRLGNKIDLRKSIADITHISEGYLVGTESLSYASIARRMSWASSRQTTRIEDIAYCLLGIFDISMPLLYGEGEKAFVRLQEEIVKISDDQTLFAWGYGTPDGQPGTTASPKIENALYGPFALKPAAFQNSGDLVPDEINEQMGAYTVTNKGLQINIPIVNLARCGTVAILACRPENMLLWMTAIPINLEGLDSMSRIGYWTCFLVRRDEMLHEVKRPMHFNRRLGAPHTTQSEMLGISFYMIRKIPKNDTGLCIWNVEPRNIWDPEQRIIRCSVNGRLDPVVIRLWRREGEGFAIVLAASDSFPKARAYVETRDKPLPFPNLAALDYRGVVSPGYPRRIQECFNLKFEIERKEIWMSNRISIYTLDIEVVHKAKEVKYR